MRIKYQEPKTKNQKPLILFTLSFILFTLSFLTADTHIPPGDVSGTWTIAGSPYIIDGHITVPVDSTLIIEPGVNIVFSGSYKFKIYGRLLAEGTVNDTIFFTAQDTTIGWKGLKFYDTDINQQDSSKVEYCRLEYGRQGSLIYCSNSSCILIKKSIITNNLDGRGISCGNSSPTIVDVAITNNTSEGYGGGISCTDSSNPSLINVTISGNTAMWGGGISCRDNSNPTLENVNIINNSAICTGGGIFCEESSPIINNVIIDGNEGSGIRCIDESSPTLNNVTISNNNRGISAQMCNPIINNTIITGNGPMGGLSGTAVNILLRNVIISDNENTDELNICSGGGIQIGGNINIVNALIVNNYTSDLGGAIFNVGGNLSLTNVVVTGNYAEEGCGGMWCQYGSNTSLTNSIFWNNNDSLGTGIEIVICGGWDDEITISYSDIEEGQNGISGGTVNWGEGNINLDPLFADTLYHLLEDSSCIDAGNPDSLYYDIEDPYNPGYALYPAMGTILNDMGAYGGHGYYEPPVAVDNYELHPATAGYELYNYPNPFNPTTTISFKLNTENTEDTELIIYNIKGQKVKTLVNEKLDAGNHSVTWNGTDNSGKNVSSGVYFYRLKVGDRTIATKKMLMLK